MKNNKLLLTLIGLLIFSSCDTTKILTSNIKSTEITDLQYFEPSSYITLIETGNRGKYNDSISRQAEQLLTKITNTFRGQLHITDDIIVMDTLLRHKLQKEINYLMLSASRKQSIDSLRIGPMLDSILESKGKRFGLITVSSGFTRTKENYRNQNIKGGGMAVATLGMYYQVPIKANSTVYAMIVDAKEKNIAFFRKTFQKDKEPLDENVITGQLQKLFNDYFK